MSYDIIRHFADSYALAAMVVLFVGIVVWTLFRPGARSSADEAAHIPLKED